MKYYWYKKGEGGTRMKPYFRHKKLKSFQGKDNLHYGEKKEYITWWEADYSTHISRRTMKKNWRKELELLGEI